MILTSGRRPAASRSCRRRRDDELPATRGLPVAAASRAPSPAVYEPIQPLSTRERVREPVTASSTPCHFENTMPCLRLSVRSDCRASGVTRRRIRLASNPNCLTAIMLSVVSLAGCSGKKDGPSAPGQTPIISRAALVPAATSDFIDARGSQLAPTGPGGQVFDDFTFTAQSTIKTVSWQGSYCVPTNGTVAPAPTATAFKVAFYADSSGRPKLSGVPLQIATYSLAQVGETLDRAYPGLTCNTATNTTYGFYRYQVTLTTPFTAAANTKFWFSVQAQTPTYNVAWGWRNGLVDNNSSLIFFSNAFITNSFDRAFALTP